ncbi:MULTISPECIES: acyl-CoA thioesterase [Comamonas]|uniref:acyl-CoA thioesterase n=1 Tax=Comamonas TaxID=283 RepID=UPI000DE76FDA|nr:MULTISPECIES: acyl-CoA thioesterase [Comamonas]PWB19733.1 acyl-CoA thioesterase [Comamonas sp. JNW]
MTTPTGFAELQELVLPALANHHGTLFAGQGLQLMAKAAFLAARSLAQREVVMAAVSRVDFVAPAPVGHALTLRAWVSRVGRSSMTVCVTGSAGLPGTPPELVLQGLFDMVAVDAKGRPIPLDCAYLNQEPLL